MTPRRCEPPGGEEAALPVGAVTAPPEASDRLLPGEAGQGGRAAGQPHLGVQQRHR